jgi:hypothetical protein
LLRELRSSTSCGFRPVPEPAERAGLVAIPTAQPAGTRGVERGNIELPCPYLLNHPVDGVTPESLKRSTTVQTSIAKKWLGNVLFQPGFFRKFSEKYLPLHRYHAPGGFGCASSPAAVTTPQMRYTCIQVPSHEKLLYETSFHFFILHYVTK